MSRMMRIAAIVALAGAVTGQSFYATADDKPKMTTKEIMKKYHKGKTSPVQTVLAGKADEAMLKDFLGYYQEMAAQKPPVGDDASWKAKTTALVDATQGLIDKKPDALKTMKAALDCKACHSVHQAKK